MDYLEQELHTADKTIDELEAELRGAGGGPTKSDERGAPVPRPGDSEV